MKYLAENKTIRRMEQMDKFLHFELTKTKFNQSTSTFTCINIFYTHFFPYITHNVKSMWNRSKSFTPQTSHKIHVLKIQQMDSFWFFHFLNSFETNLFYVLCCYITSSPHTPTHTSTIHYTQYLNVLLQKR